MLFPIWKHCFKRQIMIYKRRDSNPAMGIDGIENRYAYYQFA
jgi:hypothetical protein